MSPNERVASMLKAYGDLTRVALCDYLRPEEPRRHLYDVAADYPWRGGRMLRPSLCVATARAFGAGEADAVRTAAGIELLHNAFLIHDDVEDDSDARRGQATLHVLHGVPIAINTGDALLMLGLRALMDNRVRLGPRLTLAVLEDAGRMVRESVEGQAIELGWRRDNTTNVSDEDYLHMVLKKTCWYTTIFPVRMGMLIGTRSEHDLDRVVRFGFFLGAAFQIQDDLLNLEGDQTRYGKERDGDIREGKRTLMLARLLRVAAPEEKDRLRTFLAQTRGDRSDADVSWVRERMDAYGCLEHARLVAHALAGAAQHEFHTQFRDVPDGPHRDFLQGLARWVLTRV